MTLRIGTRGSALARTQSGTILQRITDFGHSAELHIIRTAGDRNQHDAFGSIGAQGVFVREIEQALLAGDIDLAVHSYKDLPTSSPDGLVVAAVPEREDPADLLLVVPAACTGNHGLALKPGATVGTASARRGAWLRHLRPDLNVQPLRGNVPTRLGRLFDGDFDAILLAAAGIRRLGGADGELAPLLQQAISIRLDPREFVTAPAQGALALQCRADDAATTQLLSRLDHHQTRVAVSAERVALALAEGGCDTAFGAFCEADGDDWRLTVLLERHAELLHATVVDDAPDRLARRAFAVLSGDAHPPSPVIG